MVAITFASHVLSASLCQTNKKPVWLMSYEQEFMHERIVCVHCTLFIGSCIASNVVELYLHVCVLCACDDGDDSSG